MRYFKKSIIIPIITLLLGAGGWQGYEFATAHYKQQGVNIAVRVILQSIERNGQVQLGGENGVILVPKVDETPEN